MVMPSRPLSAPDSTDARGTPSMFRPMKYEMSVSVPMKMPWIRQSRPMPLAKMPSSALRGSRFMMPGSASSMAMASAGKQSVMRLSHRRCVGSRIVKPMSDATKTAMTSARLDVSRKAMDFLMLS